MKAATQHFACTLCGRCCNRSPEVELSEAAALADVFVFRLMFRLHWLPRALRDAGEPGAKPADGGESFYQQKRLLGAFAAHASPTRIRRGGKTVEHIRYLTVSALALDTSPGRCSALGEGRCAIYARRPLACRTVPFHYSRAEALAESDLKAFVATPGHECDTSESADVVLEAGRIVDAGTRLARAEALSRAERDRPWKEAIVRRMRASPPANASLPSLAQIEASAQLGATTTSMRVAWRIAVDAGFMDEEECGALIAAQLATIDRELADSTCPQDARATLVEMRAQYRQVLAEGRQAFGADGRLGQAAAVRRI